MDVLETLVIIIISYKYFNVFWENRPLEEIELSDEYYNR